MALLYSASDAAESPRRYASLPRWRRSSASTMALACASALAFAASSSARRAFSSAILDVAHLLPRDVRAALHVVALCLRRGERLARGAHGLLRRDELELELHVRELRAAQVHLQLRVHPPADLPLLGVVLVVDAGLVQVHRARAGGATRVVVVVVVLVDVEIVVPDAEALHLRGQVEVVVVVEREALVGVRVVDAPRGLVGHRLRRRGGPRRPPRSRRRGARARRGRRPRRRGCSSWTRRRRGRRPRRRPSSARPRASTARTFR